MEKEDNGSPLFQVARRTSSPFPSIRSVNTLSRISEQLSFYHQTAGHIFLTRATPQNPQPVCPDKNADDSQPNTVVLFSAEDIWYITMYISYFSQVITVLEQQLNRYKQELATLWSTREGSLNNTTALTGASS